MSRDSIVLEESFKHAIDTVLSDPILSRCVSIQSEDSLQGMFVPLLRAYRYAEAIAARHCDPFSSVVAEEVISGNAHSVHDMDVVVTALDEARKLLPSQLPDNVIDDALRSCLPQIDLAEVRDNNAERMISSWWQHQVLISEAVGDDGPLFASPTEYIKSLQPSLKL